MKFRAVVTQCFSFIDSSQNNASPGVCRQLPGPGNSGESWRSPGSQLTVVPPHAASGQRGQQSQLVGEGLRGTEMGPPGHLSGDPQPGSASEGTC